MTPPDPPAPGRNGRPPSRHTLRQRLERTAALYLRDCYARKTAARSDEYAQQVELTPQYLGRRAADILGMSLRDFLRTRQLRHAQHLLRTTSYSTLDIALMSAFGSRHAFYRAFKNAYGMTPGQYRKQVLK